MRSNGKYTFSNRVQSYTLLSKIDLIWNDINAREKQATDIIMNVFAHSIPGAIRSKAEAKILQLGIATTSINLNLASKSCGIHGCRWYVFHEESKEMRNCWIIEIILNYEARSRMNQTRNLVKNPVGKVDHSLNIEVNIKTRFKRALPSSLFLCLVIIQY